MSKPATFTKDDLPLYTPAPPSPKYDAKTEAAFAAYRETFSRLRINPFGAPRRDYKEPTEEILVQIHLKALELDAALKGTDPFAVLALAREVTVLAQASIGMTNRICQLDAKVFKVMAILGSHGGRTVSDDDLHSSAWRPIHPATKWRDPETGITLVVGGIAHDDRLMYVRNDSASPWRECNAGKTIPVVPVVAAALDYLPYTSAPGQP